MLNELIAKLQQLAATYKQVITAKVEELKKNAQQKQPMAQLPQTLENVHNESLSKESAAKGPQKVSGGNKGMPHPCTLPPSLVKLIDGSKLSDNLKTKLKRILACTDESEAEKLKTLLITLESAIPNHKEDVLIFTVLHKQLDTKIADIELNSKKVKEGTLIIKNAEKGEIVEVNNDKGGVQIKVVPLKFNFQAANNNPFDDKSSRWKFYLSKPQVQGTFTLVFDKDAYIKLSGPNERSPIENDEEIIKFFKQATNIAWQDKRQTIAQSISLGEVGGRWNFAYGAIVLKWEGPKLSDRMDKRETDESDKGVFDLSSLGRFNICSFVLVFEFNLEALLTDLFTGKKDSILVDKCSLNFEIQIDIEGVFTLGNLDFWEEKKKQLPPKEQEAIDNLKQKKQATLKDSEILEKEFKNVDVATQPKSAQGKKAAERLEQATKEMYEIYDKKLETKAGKELGESIIKKAGAEIVEKIGKKVILKFIPIVNVISTVMDVIEVGKAIYDWWNTPPVYISIPENHPMNNLNQYQQGGQGSVIDSMDDNIPPHLRNR